MEHVFEVQLVIKGVALGGLVDIVECLLEGSDQFGVPDVNVQTELSTVLWLTLMNCVRLGRSLAGHLNNPGGGHRQWKLRGGSIFYRSYNKSAFIN